MTVYLRDNAWFQAENVIKMGIASSAKDRENGGYVTGEIIRGEYILILEIDSSKMRPIEKLLQHTFKQYHDYRGGGTEFYHRCIIDMIEPLLDSLNIEYKRLSKKEMQTLERCERIPQKVKKRVANVDFQGFIQRLKERSAQCCSPNLQQAHVLNQIQQYYRDNAIGKIIWACGLGKALLSILITKKLDVKTVVFGVPSVHLQKQIQEEILRVYDSATILYIGGDESSSIDAVRHHLSKVTNILFVVTTYHSCNLLLDFHFDFKIGDEAHHLVGIEKDGFRQFHKISATKTLFMTATEKTIESYGREGGGRDYSMDDETFFGKTIDTKSVQWAIENRRITDYNVLVIKNTEDQIDAMIRKFKIKDSQQSRIDKELFISAYMCLKSFEKYGNLTHVLLYTNTTEDAELVKKYISNILSLGLFSFCRDDVYNNALYSNSKIDTATEIAKFKTMRFGIISCVYLFGEGFNEPKLNGVCIACNMQSEIRIVQYLLRPNRLEKNNPNKVAYVILPYIDYDDWDNENKSYQKVRSIITQLRNVDKNIEQKIVQSVSKGEEKIKCTDTERFEDIDYIEYEECATEELKLRLRYSKAIDSKLTEDHDEFNYMKSINKFLNLTSSKEYETSECNHAHFVKEPEQYFRSKFVWTNWYDFLGMDTSVFIQTKDEWILFCRDKLINSLDDYYDKCNLYSVLPKHPCDFYKEFTSVSTELGFSRKRRW